MSAVFRIQFLILLFSILFFVFDSLLLHTHLSLWRFWILET